MKRCSMSLIFREMQSKTTMRYHLPPVWMAPITKTRDTNVGKDVEDKGNLVHCWWECRLVQPLWKTVRSVLKKWKIELSRWSRNSTPENIFEGNKITTWKRSLHSMFTAALFFLSKCLFIFERERERERASMGRAEREGDENPKQGRLLRLTEANSHTSSHMAG